MQYLDSIGGNLFKMNSFARMNAGSSVKTAICSWKCVQAEQISATELGFMCQDNDRSRKFAQNEQLSANELEFKRQDFAEICST